MRPGAEWVAWRKEEFEDDGGVGIGASGSAGGTCVFSAANATAFASASDSGSMSATNAPVALRMAADSDGVPAASVVAGKIASASSTSTAATAAGIAAAVVSA